MPYPYLSGLWGADIQNRANCASACVSCNRWRSFFVMARQLKNETVSSEDDSEPFLLPNHCATGSERRHYFTFPHCPVQIQKNTRCSWRLTRVTSWSWRNTRWSMNHLRLMALLRQISQCTWPLQ
ncbi:uncharacterized protein LOC144114742 isoform X2 [Amblyomma americanum]